MHLEIITRYMALDFVLSIYRLNDSLNKKHVSLGLQSFGPLVPCPQSLDPLFIHMPLGELFCVESIIAVIKWPLWYFQLVFVSNMHVILIIVFED